MAVATEAVTVRLKGELADSAPAVEEDARWAVYQYIAFGKAFWTGCKTIDLVERVQWA